MTYAEPFISVAELAARSVDDDLPLPKSWIHGLVEEWAKTGAVSMVRCRCNMSSIPHDDSECR
jgi:hypothetical protein